MSIAGTSGVGSLGRMFAVAACATGAGRLQSDIDPPRAPEGNREVK